MCEGTLTGSKCICRWAGEGWGTCGRMCVCVTHRHPCAHRQVCVRACQDHMMFMCVRVSMLASAALANTALRRHTSCVTHPLADAACKHGRYVERMHEDVLQHSRVKFLPACALQMCSDARCSTPCTPSPRSGTSPLVPLSCSSSFHFSKLAGAAAVFGTFV